MADGDARFLFFSPDPASAAGAVWIRGDQRPAAGQVLAIGIPDEPCGCADSIRGTTGGVARDAPGVEEDADPCESGGSVHRVRAETTIVMSTTNDRKIARSLTLVVFVLFLLIASLRIGSGDGETIYQVTKSIIEGHGCAIPAPSPDAVVVDSWGEPISSEHLNGGGPYGAWGVDGRYYAQYGLGQSLIAVPLYVLGWGLQSITGWGTEGFVTRAAVTLISPLSLALMAGVMFRLARHLGYRQDVSVLTALIVCLATPLVVYSKTFFSEPLVSYLLSAAVLAAVRADCNCTRNWMVCGCALASAMMVKPVVAAVVPVFALFAFWSGRFRWASLLGVSLPVLIAIAGVASFNWIRFGSPLDTGYRTAAWNVLPWVGLAGLLVSPGKGLIWYCPALLLGLVGAVSLFRRNPRLIWLLAGVVSVYIVVHSAYNHWHGGGAWGPRLILPIVPLVVFPLVALLERKYRQPGPQLAIAAVLALGLIIQLPAILVHPARTLQSLYQQSSSPTEYTQRLIYRPADSPLLGQWKSFLETAAIMRSPGIRADVVGVARAAGGEGADSLTTAAGYLAFNVFDFWSVYWLLLGVSPGILLFTGGALVLLGCRAGWCLRGCLVRACD